MKLLHLFEIRDPEIIKFKTAIDYFNNLGLTTTQKKSTNTKVRHLRFKNKIEEIEKVAKLNNIEISYDDVPTMSGSYDTFSMKLPSNHENELLADASFYAVSQLKSDVSKDGKKVQRRVASKQLIPTHFGVGNGKAYNKNQVVDITRSNITKVVSDPVIAEYLSQLLDVATGARSKVDAEINGQVSEPDRKTIGIDFGEILTPLKIADGSDTIKFPSGNEMLSDVNINDKQVSVKSATGSGTSFKAFENLMNTYRNGVESGQISATDEERQVHDFFRAFIDTKGKNVDKIIAGSSFADTEEHRALAKLVGNENFTFNDLVKFSQQFDNSKEGYKQFLETIYPVSVAGGHNKPVGLPQDHRYFIGKITDNPKPKTAGYPSWNANNPTAGANILTYILGVGFLQDAKKVEKAEVANKVLKKMLGGAGAILAFIQITKDGQIDVKHKAFKDIEYSFQYHAPSHIPGNNLPGVTLSL